MVITVGSLEPYEKLCSRYERGHSSAKGVRDHEAGAFAKFIFWRAKRRYGHVPLLTRIRANDSTLLALGELMGRYTSARGTLAPKLKESAQLKVATMVGCPFLIRHPFCRGQKDRNHRRAIE
jgi:hypothetical protein